jgi:L-alanine-DL-glutamate epimerase-like enolase superfamily enzyme
MEIVRVDLPLREPLPTASGPLTIRRGVVAVDRAAGAIAELTPHPDLSSTTADGLFHSFAHRSADAPPEKAVLEAWLVADRDARTAGLPVAAVLSPTHAERVLVNALLGPGAVADDAHRLVGVGFGTIKIKVGSDVPREAARISAMREAVGPHVGLRIDANGRWAIEEALAAIEAMKPLGVEYIEDPLPPDADWGPLASSPVPLAIDAPSPSDAILRIVDVVVLKPAMATPAASMEAAQRVRDQGADVVVTSIIDGAVGVAAALNVAAALGVDRACGLATSTLLAKDLGDPPPIREGSMALSRPGVGVVLDADRLAAVTVGETSESS